MSDEEEVYSEEEAQGEEEEQEEEKEEEAPAPRSDGEEGEKDAKKSDGAKAESEEEDGEEADDDKVKDEIGKDVKADRGKDDEEEESAPPPKREQPPPSRSAPAAAKGPSEAEIAMQKRRSQLAAAGIEEQYLELLDAARKEREAIEDEIKVLRDRTKRKLGDIGGLDEDAQALLAANAEERAGMETEIREMRSRSEKRKREREEEEKRAAERRSVEEARRKSEEEDRRRKKDEEESKKKADRAAKMEQFEKMKNPPKPNFVISKRDDIFRAAAGEEDEEEVEKKSKEQLEAEKKAILSQRLPSKPNVQEMDEAKLGEKAKELFKELCRLEGEKYDLEKRFKEQQRDMMELAERARSINKVGKGGLKRQMLDDEDPMASKFAGIPAKIEMYSKYERQKDKRNFGEKHVVFHGPTWCFPAEKVKPTKNVKFNADTGLPEYEDIEGAEAEQQEEVAAEGEE